MRVSSRSIVVGCLLSAAVLLSSVSVSAQSPKTAPKADSTANEVLRSAGDEAKFRVISGFSGSKSTPYFIESPGIHFAPVFADIEAQDWAAAHQKLTRATLAGEVSKSAGMSFLAAYVAHRSGNHAHALALFQTLVDGPIVELDDYIHYYAAKSAQAAGQYHEAALHAAYIKPESLLYQSSLTELSKALIAVGSPADLQRAAEILALYIKLFPGRSEAVEARMTLAGLLEKKKDFQRAAEYYFAVWDEFPLSSHAGSARKKLDALMPKLKKEIAAKFGAISSPQREMRRYSVYFDQHKSETLIPELSAAAETWKKGSPERCEALFLVARSHTKLRQHTNGWPVYERVIKECKGTDFELRSLYLGGRGLWNSNQRAEARVVFKRIWTEFPTHSFADDSMYFSARILREEGKNEEARALLRDQVKRYPSGDMATDAHWLLVREMFEAKNYKGVIEYVDGLKETGENDLYTRGRLHYFRARAQEFSGNPKTAEKSYASVITSYPTTYYALLAFNRRAELLGNASSSGSKRDVCAQNQQLCKTTFKKIDSPETIKIPEALREEDNFKKGSILLSLGLTELARQEFGALRSLHAKEPDTLWALAYLLDSAQAYPISHDIPRRSIENWVTGYPDNTTRARWEVAYPTPFKPLVTEWATARKIPVELVYAIMREESGFNPRVESWANARGLLQLMEPTAKNVARTDKFGELSSPQLFEPAINIRLGTGYMAELSGQLKAHPALIIAGYNGGHGNVSRWLNERGELPLDLWVEDIPYGQTRDYTKRVLTSFWTYNYLYGDQQVPEIPFLLK